MRTHRFTGFFAAALVVSFSAHAAGNYAGKDIAPRGMPKYDELTDDEIESLRHFIRQRARETMPARKN